MRCPQCRHVSSEQDPKFCSQCGNRLPPAAPAAAVKNSLTCSAPEGEQELGKPLKEDRDLQSIPDSGDWQESPENSISDASWTVVQKSKKKRRKKKTQNQHDPSHSSSLSLSLPDLSSLSLLSSPGSLDVSMSYSQAQQGDLASQPGHPLASGTPPVEEAVSLGSAVQAQDGDSPMEDQPAGTTGAAPSGTQEPRRGQDSHALVGSGDQSPSGEQLSPTTSTCKDHPGAANVTQQSESPGDNSEPKEKAQKQRQQGTGKTAEPPNKANKSTEDMKDKTQAAQQPLESPHTPQGSCQKAEAKGKSADAGGETSKNEHVMLENRKKAEESDRTQPATVKNEKEQRNLSVVAQEVTASMLGPGEGLTVYFHAILSKDFKVDPSCHQVFVRGGKGLGKPEWTNACKMHFAKHLQETGYLIEGSMVIPKESIDCPIPYKYFIFKAQNSMEYEFIYKKQKKDEHVNRCLHIPPQLEANGEWHQYDDIICKKPGVLKKATNWWNDNLRKDLVAGKHMAAEIMLDRIFSILQTWNLINLRNFFAQFMQFHFVIREPVVYEGKKEIWSDLQYKVEEVKEHLWECLKKQMAPFLEGKSGDPLPKDLPVKSKLQMGLIVLFIVNKIHISLPKSDTSLSCLLIPSTSLPDALHSDLRHFRSTTERWGEYLVELCNLGIVEGGTYHWLGTLPVLHYCMQLTPAKHEPLNQLEDTWAGLEGILFSKFRESAASQ